jgi:hypothetical protein
MATRPALLPTRREVEAKAKDIALPSARAGGEPKRRESARREC